MPSPARAPRIVVPLRFTAAWRRIAGAVVCSALLPAAAAAQVLEWDNQPTLRFGDALRLDIHARLQTDVRLHDDVEPEEGEESPRDRLSFPRRRVGVEGTLFKRVEFQIEREIEETDPWRDVYADVRVTPALRVRAGHFKIPFSLERTTSGYNLDFLERSAGAEELAPARQVGVMAHGRLAGRLVRYEAGMFERDDDAFEAGDAKWSTLAGRLRLEPLRGNEDEGGHDLRFGVAVTRSEIPEGLFGLRGQFVTGETFFRRMFVSGRRARLGVEGLWDSEHVSVKGEIIRVLDARTGQGVDNGDLSDLVLDSQYISGVWHVARAGRNRRPAVDLAARFERTAFGSGDQTGDPAIHPRAEHVAPIRTGTWTLGGTWFVNRWVKVQANAVRQQIQDPAGALQRALGPFWSSALRLQFSM